MAGSLRRKNEVDDDDERARICRRLNARGSSARAARLSSGWAAGVRLAFIVVAALILLMGGAQVETAHAETQLLRIGIQPGMSYLALYVMQREGMIERHARDAGLSDLRVAWIVSANGSVITDGVLSGGIDMAGTGIPAFVTLWAKGRGLVDIKGIASYGSLPGVLVSRNPSVKTIADFTTADRIAVPAAKASIQAIILAMAAEKVFGPGQHGRLDSLETSLSHPDAMVAVVSGHSEVNAHFTTSPYYQMEPKQPGVHVVLTKEDVFPGPLTNGLLWTTARFRAANPGVMRAVRESLEEAVTLIHTDHARAAADYLSLSKEKLDVSELTAIVRELSDRWETVPRGIYPVASFMYRIGMIKLAPTSWRDMFFEEGWAEGGS
jgi:NitT/TauT family transport system substrate-binding protein